MKVRRNPSGKSYGQQERVVGLGVGVECGRVAASPCEGDQGPVAMVSASPGALERGDDSRRNVVQSRTVQ